MSELIFITGGVRSGKSKFAVELASSFSSQITFIATAPFSDSEMEKRINLHQRSRPSHWQTVEEQKDVSAVLSKINSPQKVIIIDCLTLLISNLLLQKKSEKEILTQIKAIADKAKKLNRVTIVVSNEVGWGVVPPTELGRSFRDISGTANQIIAQKSNQVWLLVCGIPYKIKEEKI